MKRSEDALSASAGRAEQSSLPPGKLSANTLRCLVASASQTRRNLLTQAAADAGWDDVVCVSPDQALGQFRRFVFQFAMVDLDDRGGTPDGVRELIQTLSQDSSRVLIGVCGHEADPEEEIWIRQLGIWLYLPGVTTASEVSLAYEQALQIVAQRQDEEPTHS